MKQKKFSIFLFILLIAPIGLLIFSKARSENQSEIEKAVGYIKALPQTAWSSMALAAAGEANIDLNHLKSIPTEQKSSTNYAKYILALAANGKNPADFGNEDYVEKLKSYYNQESKQFASEQFINDDVWAVLALGAIGQEDSLIVQDAKDYILRHQNPDGGWSYDISVFSSDTNDTAAAIMSLLEAGIPASSPAIQNAVNYLKSQQNDDGGFAYVTDSVSDACSDAWAISTIYKLGQNPADSTWVKNEKNPFDHLKSLQDEDGGFWWQVEGDNKFCSSYALIALTENYYPVETIYNEHQLQIEGQDSTICSIKVNGGTPIDLVIKGSQMCGFDYSIAEFTGMGLYLEKVNGENNWMYMVNNVSLMVGADSYYLEPGDDVLWLSGQWLDNGWLPTKVELTKNENLIKIKAKYYNSESATWQDLELEGIIIKIDSSDFTTNNLGEIEASLSSLESGFYEVFIESQIINETGYIRSEKESLKVGDVPSEHGVGLKVEIERIEPQGKGRQAEISFSVNPDILDFGKLKPGGNVVSDLTITNGETAIILEAEVNGASVFRDNLEVGENFWQIFSTEVEANQNEVLPVRLSIPHSYDDSFGSLEGDLTFWAIKK